MTDDGARWRIGRNRRSNDLKRRYPGEHQAHHECRASTDEKRCAEAAETIRRRTAQQGAEQRAAQLCRGKPPE